MKNYLSYSYLQIHKLKLIKSSLLKWCKTHLQILYYRKYLDIYNLHCVKDCITVSWELSRVMKSFIDNITIVAICSTRFAKIKRIWLIKKLNKKTKIEINLISLESKILITNTRIVFNLRKNNKNLIISMEFKAANNHPKIIN
jgi:hypothetical protein